MTQARQARSTPAASAVPGGRRLSTVLAVVFTAAAAVIAACVALVVGVPRPSALHVVLAVVLALIADLELLSLRSGHEIEAYTLSDTSLLLGLWLLPVRWLVLVGAASVLVLNLLRRRSVVKSCYNAAVFAVGIAVSGFVGELVQRRLERPVTLREALALAAAAAVYSLWSAVAIALAVAAASGVPVGGLLRRGYRLRLLVAGGNIALGIGVIVLARVSVVTLLVLPPVLAVLVYTYRSNQRSIEERDAWQQLNAAAEGLSGLGEHELVAATEQHARYLFAPDSAELLLGAHEPSAAVPKPSVPARRRLRSVEVPLDPSGTLGLLRLHFDSPVRWSQRENRILSAYANTVASRLLNARLYEEARCQAQDKAYEAEHDALTGLPNRRLLLSRGERAVAEAAQSGDVAGLLLIDLDRFKEVNDTLGHVAGDRLLCEVASRLALHTRRGDLVARLGGDEFAVLVTGMASPESVVALADGLVRLIGEPLTCDGLTLSVEGSIGVACYPDDAQDMAELLQRADIAMYQAKSMRGAAQRYRRDLDDTDSALDRLELMGELRQAIASGELVAWFQPQVSLVTGEVTTVEALARWEHPTRGLLAPAEFVPSVEHSGLVREFTLHLMALSVSACADWRRFAPSLGIAVNLSARNLADLTLPGEVLRLLAEHRLPAEALTLEITETAVMSEHELAEQVLGRLHDLGVRLSIDDFGTGYSSLTLLQRVPVHEIKVDRGFVADMLDKSNAAIVRATVGLAHSLSLRVVAEGVERPGQLEALAALRCDYAQGFYVGAPMTRQAMEAWLLDHVATVADAAAAGGADVLPLRARRTAGG